MSADLATVGQIAGTRRTGQLRSLVALAGAGFRRFATYRQATLAAISTNTVFGFLRCYILLAAVATSATGAVAGYDPRQLATYCWVSQGLIGVMQLWGFMELSDRIRSGAVVGDLLRPMHPVLTYLASDLGRAAYAALTRLIAPVVTGGLLFSLFIPTRTSTYPLFAVSVLLGVVVSFGCRYLINSAAYWLLDIRGLILVWSLLTAAGAGLAFPLHFLPQPLVWALWVATPLPSILQAPLDVVVERGTTAQLVGIVAGQAAWAIVVLGLSVWVQHRAERKLVVQGG